MPQEATKTMLVNNNHHRRPPWRATSAVLLTSLVSSLIIIGVVYETQMSMKNNVLRLWSASLIAAMQKNKSHPARLAPFLSSPPRSAADEENRQPVANTAMYDNAAVSMTDKPHYRLAEQTLFLFPMAFFRNR